MPFELFRHREHSASTPGGVGAPSADDAGSAAFEAFTEDRRITGHVRVEGRLSDALNRREPLAVTGVSVAPLESRDQLAAAPEVHALDPYELVVVAAGPDSQPALSPEQRAALRARKTRYEVCFQLTGAYVCGVVHLHPGTDPADPVSYHSELFVPVTEPAVRVAGVELADPAPDVVLVNRAYLQAVIPVDRSSGAWVIDVAEEADRSTAALTGAASDPETASA